MGNNIDNRRSLAIIVVSLVVALTLSAWPADGANILGLFTSHSRSHLIVHMSVAKALAAQGHNVTVVASYSPTITHNNITVIVIPPTMAQKQIFETMLKDVAKSKTTNFSFFIRSLGFISVLMEHQYDSLLDERFTPVYKQKFDLVIIGYFLNEFQLGVAAKLKCPVIINWSQMSMELTDSLVGNPSEVSYVPVIQTVVEKGQQTMRFLKRLENLLKTILSRVLVLVSNWYMQSYYNLLFANETARDFPSFDEMKRNISLVFTSSHSHSEGPIRAFVPALIEIGGIHVKEKPEALPEDIASFMNKATHGVILLSLGSNFRSSDIRTELVHTMFTVLSGLKQHIIWKWEHPEVTPGDAPNILYKKWLPQDDILAHNKTRLFITHAGKGGVAEALYHAVPMLALPIFGDQPSNADRMVRNGYGLALDLFSLTEAAFKAKLYELLDNQTYAQNLASFSKLYRDRPLTARESVVFWTEYVLRHHGAPHLQSPAVHMSALAYYNVDVYALLLFMLASVLFLISFIGIVTWHKVSKYTMKTKAQNKVKQN